MLTLGVLLVWVSDRMPVWLVMACGLLFVVPGAVALVGWFRRDKSVSAPPFYPVAALGSILLGAILLLFPASFVKVLMYLLAALIFLASSVQIYGIFHLRGLGVPLSGWYAVVPVAVLGAGVYVVLYPDLAAALPFIVIGAAGMVYGLLELWTAWLLSRYRRRMAREEKVS